MVELVWPNVLGVPGEGKNYWGELIKIPGGRPLGWVPSLYLGGLTVALALNSLAIRRGPPWRVWLSVIAWTSVFASFGQYTSPIWMARALSANVGLNVGSPMAARPRPHRLGLRRRSASMATSAMVTAAFTGGWRPFCRVFASFGSPRSSYTFTALALAGLAGLGWDRVSSGRARGTIAVFCVLLAMTLAALVGVAFKREAILASFRTLSGPSMFGPFEADAGYQAVFHSLGQATTVFGLGLFLTTLARRHAQLAGSAALVLMTADLAAANSRFVVTCPQSVFETKPEVLSAIENAERMDPSPGPFRVHRMLNWFPGIWSKNPSRDRIAEIVAWEHDTLNPKYGINYGLEYTCALGVAQLADYEQFFPSFSLKLLDQPLAQDLGIGLGEDVYLPRSPGLRPMEYPLRDCAI